MKKKDSQEKMTARIPGLSTPLCRRGEMPLCQDAVAPRKGVLAQAIMELGHVNKTLYFLNYIELVKERKSTLFRGVR
ncbi:hypothetical protein BS639_24185 [Rouxiella silvae]|uniref:Uncharacterized protein n=1 Tax=Rouxiella silvae TaxID=1646373 RepID=A0ABX3TTW2_9GAMM|nr:hypothetical protein [Rouxiella silvae]ORJ18650.1 hypothetical protein BS639_24185 [Rouxiella silvae]